MLYDIFGWTRMEVQFSIVIALLQVIIQVFEIYEYIDAPYIIAD